MFTETVSVSGNGTYTTSAGYTLPHQRLSDRDSATGSSATAVTRTITVRPAQGSEPVTVRQANPSLSTTASPGSVTLSNTAPPILKDAATLAGGYYETGTLTFDLYGPDGLTVVHTEVVSVSGNGTYNTPVGYTLPTTGTVIGTYQWIVSYNGDINNNGVTSVKGSEPVNVDVESTTVQDLVRLGYHDQPTRIVVAFSAALDPATASDLANYQLVAVYSRHHGVSAPIPIKVAAVYNPITHTVKTSTVPSTLPISPVSADDFRGPRPTAIPSPVMAGRVVRSSRSSERTRLEERSHSPRPAPCPDHRTSRDEDRARR